MSYDLSINDYIRKLRIYIDELLSTNQKVLLRKELTEQPRNDEETPCYERRV
jgi:hypothetical protein